VARVPHVPIVEVRTHAVEAALRLPFVTALRRTSHVRSLLVELVDEQGRRGLGEAPQVWQVTGASVAGARACVEEVLSPLLRGCDPDDLTATTRRVRAAVAGNRSAVAAVDVALHDLAARRLGVPLYRLLGGASGRVATDVTLSAGTGAELAVAAADRVTDGFDVLKVKVGLADSPAEEVARVRAVRAAVGPGVRLRLDANQAWRPREAVAVVRGVEDAGLDVELVEQPVHRRDVAGLAWVSDRVHTPILADEAVFSPADLLEVIGRRAADLVNVKLVKCGGLGPARTLLGMAEAAGMGTLVGSMMETAVGVAAAASLAAGYGTSHTCDLDAAWWLADPPPGAPRYRAGALHLSDGSGLGMTMRNGWGAAESLPNG
jgi:L-alanine-DL-glutamate epimerase-like enolase superfamily enzyme